MLQSPAPMGQQCWPPMSAQLYSGRPSLGSSSPTLSARTMSVPRVTPLASPTPGSRMGSFTPGTNSFTPGTNSFTPGMLSTATSPRISPRSSRATSPRSMAVRPVQTLPLPESMRIPLGGPTRVVQTLPLPESMRIPLGGPTQSMRAPLSTAARVLSEAPSGQPVVRQTHGLEESLAMVVDSWKGAESPTVQPPRLLSRATAAQPPRQLTSRSASEATLQLAQPSRALLPSKSAASQSTRAASSDLQLFSGAGAMMSQMPSSQAVWQTYAAPDAGSVWQTTSSTQGSVLLKSVPQSPPVSGRASAPPRMFREGCEAATLDEFMQMRYAELQAEVRKAWKDASGIAGEHIVAPERSCIVATSYRDAADSPGLIELLSVSDLVADRPPTLARDPPEINNGTVSRWSTGCSTGSSRTLRGSRSMPCFDDSVSSSRGLSSYRSYDPSGSARRSGRRRGSPSPPRDGSRRARSQCPPKGMILKFPEWALGQDDINEKYTLMWDECISYGGLNSLNRHTTGVVPGCCCLIKAKTRKGSGLRAVKIIPKTHIRYPKLFQSQLSAYGDANHPNVCKLLDLYEDSTYVYMVMEHLAGPSLLEQAINDPHFNERDAASAVKALLQVVDHLHKNQLLHQNIHPDNLGFSKHFRTGTGSSHYETGLKLFDFGLCLSGKQLKSILSATGMDDWPTPPPLQAAGARSSGGDRCLPPELRSHGRETTHSDVAKLAASDYREGRSELVHSVLEGSDIWSVGCIMHLLLSGRLPPEKTSTSHAYASEWTDCQQRGHICIPSGVDSSAVELCSWMLEPDPLRRPTAAEALDCEWFPFCTLLKEGHRTVSGPLKAKKNCPYTPASVEVKSLLRLHHEQCQLRKLILRASAILDSPCFSLGNSQSLQIISEDDCTAEASCLLPLGPNLSDPVLTEVMKAVHGMCENTFFTLLSSLGATAGYKAELISEGCLMEAMDEAMDLLGDVNLRAILSKARRGRTHQGVSMPEFADFILMCVCTA